MNAQNILLLLWARYAESTGIEPDGSPLTLDARWSCKSSQVVFLIMRMASSKQQAAQPKLFAGLAGRKNNTLSLSQSKHQINLLCDYKDNGEGRGATQF
jgi:hypothetical protein